MFLRRLFCRRVDDSYDHLSSELLPANNVDSEVSNPNVSDPEVSDPEVSFPEVSNPEVSDPEAVEIENKKTQTEEKPRIDRDNEHIRLSTIRLAEQTRERVRKEHENRQPIGTYMIFLESLMVGNVVNNDFVTACNDYEGNEHTPTYDPCKYAMYHKRLDLFAYAMGNGVQVKSDIYVLPIQNNYIDGLKMLCDMRIPFPREVVTTPLNMIAIKYLLTRGMKPDATAKLLLM